MQDIYVEHMIKRKPDNLARFSFYLFVVLTVLSVLAGLLIPIVLIAAAIFGVAAYLSKNRINLEYEYSYTNGVLDIDTIYNKENRKRSFSVDMENVTEIRKPKFDTRYSKNFSDRESVNDHYVMQINNEEKRTEVLVQPGEEIINTIRRKYSQLFV